MKNGRITAAICFVVLAIVSLIVWQLAYGQASNSLWAKDANKWLTIANLSKYGAMASGGLAVIFALLGLQGNNNKS